MAELRLLAALGARRPDGLFFAGDLGQRIFRTPFSWRALGIDVRGRSHTLRVNYRTSHQIRRQADRLLPGEIADVDGNAERRAGTVSVFNGAEPVVAILGSPEEERAVIAEWLAERKQAGYAPTRSACSSDRTPNWSGRRSRARGRVLHGRSAPARRRCLRLGGGGHHARGEGPGVPRRGGHRLRRRSAAIAGQNRDVGDPADLEDVYATERHLLYVACTRARDHLLVTGVEPASEFLDDLRAI